MPYNWKRKIRKIDGQNKQVKVRTRNGREQVRIIGIRNLTDKTAKKQDRVRKPFYYSATDKRKCRKIL